VDRKAAQPVFIENAPNRARFRRVIVSRRSYRRPLLILMAMVGTLLLIACINLSNLTLARVGVRRAEFMIRTALGASRWRLIRQLLTETLLLLVLGGSVGLLFAWLNAPYLLSRMWSGFVPLNLTTKVDVRVLGFTAAAAVLTTVIAGLFPSLHLRTGVAVSRTVRTGFQPARWLVPGQFALSFTVVVVALLLAGTLSRF
jgi:predicted lysophospholipase L1 biosynthesis ABC-type transport system permease subunit